MALPGRVQKFMKAANDSGFKEVAIFIDAARVTDEARGKWMERRLKEVRTSKNPLPSQLGSLP